MSIDIYAYNRLIAAANALGAAVEMDCNGEILIFTGLGLDGANRIAVWCEECDNGDNVPNEGCNACFRPSRFRNQNVLIGSEGS